MTDVGERTADRTAKAEGSIEAWAKAQRLRCKAGDHCWSGWQSNGSSNGAPVVNRSGDSMAWEHDLGECSIHTRECLVCPARQRMLQRWGPYVDHTPGMSTREAAESQVFDL